jgi:transcriptional regulator with GAF, ATPase, and Fis domain
VRLSCSRATAGSRPNICRKACGSALDLSADSSAPPDIQAPEEERADRARQLSAAEERHRDELAALVREHAVNISAVARTLGNARVQIQRWVGRYGLDPESFRA